LKRFSLDKRVNLVYQRLLKYVTPHWRVLLFSFIAMLFYSAANAYVPFIMRDVFEILENGIKGQGLYLPFVILLTFAVRGLTDFISIYGLAWIGRRVIRDLRSLIFMKYTDLPSRYFDSSSVGMLVSKLTYNTEQVAEAISNALVVLVRDTLTIIVLVGAMVYFSPLLTSLVAITTPIVALLVSMMSKAFRRYSTKIQTSMGDATRVIESAVSAHKVVKIFEGQDYENKKFNKINKANYKMNLKLVATVSLGDALTQYTVALGVSAVIYVAFSNAASNILNAASFMGFLTAMGMLLAPLKRIVNINLALQRGIAAGESLFEIIDEPTERDDGHIESKKISGEININSISFTYDKDKGKVLNNISFNIRAGTTVAIVGRSGSGKSTLVGLLPRFYDVDKGEILLDGVNLNQYGLKNLRRQISLVSQDIMLFNDTIANNICYGGLSSLPREDILKAAESAYVMEFCDLLPNGIDSEVGEKGILLSGGQKQRIAIARAFLKNSPILILDEATSALDNESESYIQRAMTTLMDGRTTLVIAHRLSTVEKADLILVLKDGSLVESGTHQELLDIGGHYRDLHSMQFSV
tara:strand:- start:67890 stop:69638 length:1749 start_codon:yes stop_codon:yes gene_type:complete